MKNGAVRSRVWCSMKLRNIKASFILRDSVCKQKKGKNYILKHDGFTFTIYHHTPYLVNVTGVKSFERMNLARQIIEEKLQTSVVKVRIDNTFFSQKNYRNVDLAQVYNFMRYNEDFHVEYNIELFAGMYLKHKKPNYPTILFFQTGSYVMMGGKSMLLITSSETFVNKLIEKFDKVKSNIMMK